MGKKERETERGWSERQREGDTLKDGERERERKREK